TSKYVKPKDSKKEPADVIPPVTETMGHPESIENRLKVLKDLLDKNLITRDDYEKKKAAILEGL
ncbi:MAG TPA: SHOCT domain-containing protein, partial [Desulfomonilia bacterium]|nr:SHOCT domain-containing protein [Deltaproteobacteria bacterium]HRW81182.1 SHOCT domain-containing protein [Desulfomonilia bacterium]